MRTVALLVNRDKPRACEVQERLEALLKEAGFRAICCDTGNDLLARCQPADVWKGIELAFVLGGDGTLLGVARQLAYLNVPLLGINVGHLGFLTEAEPTTIEETIRRVAERDYHLEERLMIEACVHREGTEVARIIGLNDVGIAKGSFARMVTVETFVDDVFVDTYRGDGVIVSTPTGSTAYSLSCGGPIVSPHLQVMVVTPICPHTLFSRPFVIDDKQVIQFTVQARQDDVGLTVDGQVGVTLCSGDTITVRRSEVHTTLVKWRDREFFQVLRQKLHDFDAPEVPAKGLKPQL